MKIFSNFDTEFKDKLYEELTKKFWKDKVLLITRDKIFLIFKVILPLLFLLVLCFFLIIFWVIWDIWDDLNIFKWWLILFFLFMSFLFFFPKILKNLIDYYMDFAVITPKQIIAYNQIGIFSRESRSLDVEKIKTISVDKKWILKSLFNYWTIIFLSEWDESWKGDIVLEYVHDPEKVRERIMEIMELEDKK